MYIDLYRIKKKNLVEKRFIRLVEEMLKLQNPKYVCLYSYLYECQTRQVVVGPIKEVRIRMSHTDTDMEDEFVLANARRR